MKRILGVFALLLLTVAGAWADDYNPENPPDPNPLFRLTVSVSPSEAGYVSGGGRYKEGQQVRLSTSRRDDYAFLYWTCDGVQVSDQAAFYYTMPQKSVNLVAVYTYNPTNPQDPTTANSYRLYVESNLEGSCTFNLTSGAKQQAGHNIRVKATDVSQGYKFQGWYLNDEKQSDDLSFYYNMPTHDVTLTARFTYDPDSPDDPTSSQADIDNKDYIPGDANGDGDVNVTDIVEIVNAIMNNPSTRFVRDAADLNGDGEINVTDIVRVVNIIMSANHAHRRSMLAGIANVDQLTLTSNDNKTFSLLLDNQNKYVASQFDVYLPSGMTLKDMTLNQERCSAHTLSYTDIGNHCYRVLIMSIDNSEFEGNSGELLNFEVEGTGEFYIENILFVTDEQTEKWFESIRSSMSTTGIQTVVKTDAKDVYSIDGRVIGKQALSSLQGLAKGIYIVNGKKHIIKGGTLN